MLGSGSRGVVGGGFPLENKGEGDGWDRRSNRQVNAQALSKLPFSGPPFSLSPKRL